jgi:uncharacterized repeat protein (TIGR03803 family)
MSTNFFRTALLGSALVLSLAAGGAEAKVRFKVLHSFMGQDGAYPYAGVAPAPHGGFYVATNQGGSPNGGVLTLIKKDGGSQVLHAFTGGSDGLYPAGAPLVWSDGNIYGTTEQGGAFNCGTIYRYTPASGAYQQLYAAGCAPQGNFPEDGLSDVGDALVATTFRGGASDLGALIFVRSDGGTGTSCSFSGNDGSYPAAAIIPANGNLYAAPQAGGVYDNGTVTEFHFLSCGTSVLHSFAGGSDGASPFGSLLSYNNALYGTTYFGGAGTNLGTVFRINPDGSGYTILHVFQGICCGNADGSFPYSGLTLNPKDNMLYGTTTNGGNASDLGTVFKIDPNTGAESVVHSFSGPDGAHPTTANLYIKNGAVYGTTAGGGAHGIGVVFRLKT